MLRKIFKWGGYSFGITLPKQWVLKNNLSEVEIIENDKNLLIKIPKNEENIQ